MKTALDKLSHTQRLACRGIIGAMRTTPSIALETLLNLPPLHLEVKGAAATATYRLDWEERGQWIGELPGKGYTNIVDHVSRASPSTRMRQDRITATYCFRRRYSVQFPTREEWSTTAGPLGGQGLIWFTDGSKMEEGTGAGLCLSISKRETLISLGRYCTVFQAEVTAIMACALENYRRGYESKNIYIYSDSQAALKALLGCRDKSGLVKDCRSTLQDLAQRNRLTLMWVPGQIGVQGNERADKLDRMGSAILKKKN